MSSITIRTSMSSRNSEVPRRRIRLTTTSRRLKEQAKDLLLDKMTQHHQELTKEIHMMAFQSS